MTRIKTTSSEVHDHDQEPPAKRRRIDGEPAFLRPAKSASQLAPLLTILHSIPLARESLLLPAFKIDSYGSDSRWWSGSVIGTPRVSHDNMSHSFSTASEIIAESQRLMAFLDKTDRAYGSIDAFTNMEAHVNHFSNSSIDKFWKVWLNSAMVVTQDDPLTQIFTSSAVQEDSEDKSPTSTVDFQCLEIPTKGFSEDYSLYDVLDCSLWPDVQYPMLDRAYINVCAEVFTVRLYSSSPESRTPLGMTVPPVWYPDRYFLENVNEVSDMRLRKGRAAREVNGFDRQKRRFLAHEDLEKKDLDVREALRSAVDAVEIISQKEDPTSNPGYEQEQQLLSKAEGSDCAESLKTIMDRIDQKVALLEKRKEEAKRTVREITQLYTKPSDDPARPPFRKYTLRGVSTAPDTTYILRSKKKQLDLIEMDDDAESDLIVVDQWWKITYGRSSNDESAPQPGPLTQQQAVERDERCAAAGTQTNFSVTAVDLEDVLRAAKDECIDSLLLVYANQNAVDYETSELKPDLEKFVRADNRLFKQELIENHRSLNSSDETIRSSNYDPGSDMDDVALDSTPATPFDEYMNDAYEREATPMAISSPKREGSASDAEPDISPKRNKYLNDSGGVNRTGGTTLINTEEELPPYTPIAPAPPREMTQTANATLKLRSNNPYLMQMAPQQPNRIGVASEQMMRRIEEQQDTGEATNGSSSSHVEYL